MQTNTILVIPFADGIGDFVNVQPLMGALKRRFSRSSFTVAASEHGNQLVNDPSVQVVKPSGFNYEPGRMPRLVLRPRATTWADGFWDEHGLAEERVVGLVPSTNMAIKRWPLSNWLKLDASLRGAGYSTLLFCDRPESSTQRAFAHAGSS